PEAAAHHEPTAKTPRAHHTGRRRPGPGERRRSRRDPGPRYGEAAAQPFHPYHGHHLRLRMRDLSAQVFHQIPQQPDRPADAVLLLLDRRLPGDSKELVV